MSKVIDGIIAKAQAERKTIVLAEGEESRTVAAAQIIAQKGIADIILLGDEEKIRSIYPSLSKTGIKIINPLTVDSEEYAQEFYELRKNKGMTLEDARLKIKHYLNFGAMLVRKGVADGMVAGAINSTGNVLRAGLQIIKTAPGIKTVSSCFLMCFEGTTYTDKEVMVFGDSAVNIAPTAEQLADIAISSADSAKNLAGIEPRIAMLSFSTKGSAKHENVDKVVMATNMVKYARPDLVIDGELQVDAAIVPSVAQLKAPDSQVAGNANVLIFPSLEAGNIGYKLVQRFSSAEAIGPICQGFARPINDLSRGCCVEDIVSVVAITAVQAARNA
ncbi:MAG: phosphate acetyltransferase [Clostridia bacterium]|nr:phosphate acetyltransferase [Clostridia bacterium]